MAVDHAFDVAHTGLLAMDCQTGIVSTYAKPEECAGDRRFQADLKVRLYVRAS